MKSKLDILKKPVRLKIFRKDRFVPLFVILIVISLVVTIFFIRYMLLRDQWHTLDVEWHGYSIDYPALWSTQTYAASGGRGANLDYLSAAIGNFGLNIDIHQTTMENPEIEDAFDWWQETMLGWKLSNISSPIKIQIGYDDYPAMMQSYYRGSELVYGYFLVSDNRSYLLEFSRVNEVSQPIIDQILASFRLYEVGED